MDAGGVGQDRGNGAGRAHDGSSTAAAGRPDPVAMLERAVAATEAIVAGVRSDQMDLATPCTDWTVRDVIDHVVKGNAWAVANLASESGSAPRPGGDMVGNDPAAAFAASSAQMVAAFKAPGALAKMLDLPFGRMPGTAFAGFRMGDLLFSGDNIFRDGCVGVIDAHHGSNLVDYIASLRRIRDSDAEYLLPSHGPIFRKDNALLDATIARLESYTHMSDFGTCAVDWPLLDQWEDELARGQLNL